MSGYAITGLDAKPQRVEWSGLSDPTDWTPRARLFTDAPTVLAHGCFDLLHLGHIRHLQEASRLGRLVVSVTSDRFVRKGDGRPHFSAQQRAEALGALGCVDQVLINDAPDAVPMIEKLRPQIYVKGIDYAEHAPDGGLLRELSALEKCGGRFVATQTEKFSSSRLINAEKYSPEIVAYLEHGRAAGFLPRIEQAFARLASMRVLLVGEAITDQYVYVAPLAKPSKEFVLASAEVATENFNGGVHAAAAHLTGLCETEVVSQPAEQPLVKRRYVEQGFTRKLFEVYSPARLAIDDASRGELRSLVDRRASVVDCVIALDFGHGLIDGPVRDALMRAKFLAVNAQTNAGNQGFNPVTKYKSADYICVDLPEARFAAQDQFGEPQDMRETLSRAMGAEVIVTHGRDGAYWSGGKVPAIATRPVDTMGAGDCFLALTAPLIAAGLGVEEAAFVGTVAAGMKTSIVGHRAAVDGSALKQTVKALLA